MSLVLRLAARLLVFLSTRHRVIGIRDWVASLCSLLILVIASTLQAAVLLGLLPVFASIPSSYSKFAFFIAMCALIAVAFPAIAFILKLRRNGITDADYSISTGIDYKAALESGGAGFDFLGVGAAKLRHHEPQFREAVRATVSSDKKIRLLLVDPKSEAVKRLEDHDNAVGYTETVAGSISFIQALADREPQHVALRHYAPAGYTDFKPFRLFFSGGDCLVSPFVKATGVENQGRLLPQLRVTAQGWPNRSSPTLYRSFESYFSEAWITAETSGNSK